MIGTAIGPYHIHEWLGAGGMGDVYRARDVRLQRDVAVKLISRAPATDPSRVERFALEARAAGQMNHPNILTVYDVGMHDGAPFVVSELLEGESLRTILQRGALSLRKVVDYARQIAIGVAAAHDKGVVHRDLKPDNVFVTSDGRVKILDFGVAKLAQTDSGDDRGPAPYDTDPGTVLGTPAYMSPEQIRGERVDHRSDIFGFGAVLYELVQGSPAFARTTSAETMAAILKEDPPPLRTTPELARIARRCLEKSREERYQSARDLGFALEGISTEDNGRMSRSGQRSFGDRRLAAIAIAAAIGIVAIVLTLVSWRPWTTDRLEIAQRLRVDLGSEAPIAAINLQFGDAVALSPDGETIAYVAQADETTPPRLHVRPLSQLNAVEMSGTEGAVAPFFSPDSQWIAFFISQGRSPQDGGLKKVAVSGGAPIPVAEAPNQRGGAWSDDGTIVFSPDRTAGTALLRVSANGGAVTPATTLQDGELLHVWPQILPGKRGVLFTSSRTVSAFNDADLVVQLPDDRGRKIVQRGGYHGRYLPSGHLAYVHDGTLLVAPFDLERLEVTGTPVPVIEHLRSNSITGGAQFAVSDTGRLVYIPGPTTGAGTPLDWMNRDGVTTPLLARPANWLNARFAPDGSRLAMAIVGASSDVWVYDWSREQLTPITTDPSSDSSPVWTPDGRYLTFASSRGDKSTLNLYRQRVDSRTAERLTTSVNVQEPSSWHPSGKYLAFEETTRDTKKDVMILPVSGTDPSRPNIGAAFPFADTPAIEAQAAFSPDGQWIAYASNRSGRGEIYVKSFPGPGGEWPVSTGGGTHPTWSRTTNELFYGLDGQIMVSPYTVTGTTFHAGRPQLWSSGRYQTRGANRMFDLHPDGQRLALAPASPARLGTAQNSVVMVWNFFDELRRVVPPTSR